MSVATVEVQRWREEFRPAVFEVIDAFHKESLDEYGITTNRDAINYAIRVQKETSFFLLVDGKCVGILSGEIVSPLASIEKVYHESMWYVLKPYRKYGLKLFAAAESWAREVGCTKFLMVCMHNSMTQKLFKIYERMGFLPLETHFLKEL